MFTNRNYIGVLLSLLLCASAGVAQDGVQEKQAGATIAKDVTIIIQQKQVRFTAQKAVEKIQLQVFDQAGETVFDSGPVPGAEINWPLQTVAGEPLKSGIYAYKLSLKDAGSEEARVRRGQFIVDQAKDREGMGDRIWITAGAEDGVGTELTVAGNADSLIAAAGNQAHVENRKGENQSEAEKKEAEKKDGKVTNVPSDSSPYIINSAAPQEADFNITGNGVIAGTLTAGTVTATTQYNLADGRILTAQPAFTEFDAGKRNILYLGFRAGEFATSYGYGNVYVGNYAGAYAERGIENTYVGSGAGEANKLGYGNSFFGAAAGYRSEGYANSFFGRWAGANTKAEYNSFFGYYSGTNNSTGVGNSFFGTSSGRDNTTGSSNSFFGINAGWKNTEGVNNAFFGGYSGVANTTGSYNAFFGANAGEANRLGYGNSFFGAAAGYRSEGNANSFFGRWAGANTKAE